MLHSEYNFVYFVSLSQLIETAFRVFSNCTYINKLPKIVELGHILCLKEECKDCPFYTPSQPYL